MELDFARNGAERLRGAVPGEMLSAIEAIAARLPVDRAGVRLNGVAGVGPMLDSGPIKTEAASRLGSAARPVRALLFDKSEEVNWSLGWHQDRVIVVRERIDVPGYGAWTVKQGLLHVSPPWPVMASMVTVRIHLDAVGEDDAPLLIAPGSHRLGRVAEIDVAAVVRDCGIAACPADRGDMWVYSTPILHASAAKVRAGQRRVLQVDYSAMELEGGLAFMGV